MVELGGMAERLPKQLSGGQQQRVALARATVFQPRLLLLDEPFGALDRKLREQMQLEVRRLQRRLGLTTLFITHDQEEALVMSDRIAVMDKGRLQQVGPAARDLRGAGQSVHRRFHRRVQHLRGRRGSRRRAAHVTRSARARAQSSKCRPGRSGSRRRQAGSRHGTAGALRRSAAGSVRPTPVNRIDGSVTESAYIGVSDKYRIATSGRAWMSCVRLPSGPSSRRYRAGRADRGRASTPPMRA